MRKSEADGGLVDFLLRHAHGIIHNEEAREILLVRLNVTGKNLQAETLGSQ